MRSGGTGAGPQPVGGTPQKSGFLGAGQKWGQRGGPSIHPVANFASKFMKITSKGPAAGGRSQLLAPCSVQSRAVWRGARVCGVAASDLSDFYRSH